VQVAVFALTAALSATTGLPTPTGRPDLAVIDATGSASAVDYENKVVLIDAWATWCAPCLEELPRLRRLAERHRDHLVIVGLSVDRMPRRDFVTWLQRKDVRWPQHFDGRGYDSPAALSLGVDAVPETWLHDRKGRLVARGLRGATLEAAIDLLVHGEVKP
jgi:thiol-disulfide isomerase/thioredoxin